MRRKEEEEEETEGEEEDKGEENEGDEEVEHICLMIMRVLGILMIILMMKTF